MNRILAAVALCIALCAIPANAQITTSQSGPWSSPATWSTGVPAASDNVVIAAGHTVVVDVPSAVCNSLSFGDTSAHLGFESFGALSINGDLAFGRSYHKVFSKWDAGGKLKFTGSGAQRVDSLSTSTTTTTQPFFMEIVVDKPGGTLTLSRIDRKFNLGTSLEIINGAVVLDSSCDLQGRSLGGDLATEPTIMIRSGGSFTMWPGASHIGSGTSGTPRPKIGKVTIFGMMTVVSTSTNKVNFGDIDVEAGGTLTITTGWSSSNLNLFNPGTITIKDGGTLNTSSTTNIWASGTAVNLMNGGTFKTTASTTYFPPTFNNNGTVWYARGSTASTDQTMADMDYKRLVISFTNNGTKKVWAMTANRTVSDSLEVNNSGILQITAAAPQVLTIGKTLRLTSGSVDNSSASVTTTLSNDAVVSRATGTLAAAPVFAGSVSVRYTSTTTAVTTGPELPTAEDAMQNFSIIGSMPVTLGAGATVNGTLTLSSGSLELGTSTLTLASGAWVRRATGTISGAPVYAGGANIAYISSVGSVTTGAELPDIVDTLSIESPMNVTLGKSAAVKSALRLTRGLLYLGPNSLTMKTGAVYQGTASDSTMIVTNDTGSLKVSPAADGTLFFPIGDTTGSVRFVPASLAFTGGAYSSAEVSVRTVSAKHPENASTAHYLNRYWRVAATGITGFSCAAQFQYASSDVSGSETAMLTGQWNGSAWKRYGGVDAVQHRASVVVTSFSDFTCGETAGLTAVETPQSALPKEYALGQNFPNPFNPSTTIGYALPVRSRVTITVFNILGQVLATVVSGEQAAGYHAAAFDAPFASGVYIYKMEARPLDTQGRIVTFVRKMVLTK